MTRLLSPFAAKTDALCKVMREKPFGTGSPPRRIIPFAEHRALPYGKGATLFCRFRLTNGRPAPKIKQHRISFRSSVG